MDHPAPYHYYHQPNPIPVPYDSDAGVHDTSYVPSETEMSVSSSATTDDASMIRLSECSASDAGGSDAQMRSDVSSVAASASTLYPKDSISLRGRNPVHQRQHSSSSGARSENDAGEVVSFHTSSGGQLFKQVYGRTFSSQSDNYMLPADGTEHSRLDIQHNLLKVHLGGLYPRWECVERVLCPEQAERPGILDVGTGSGRWAIEMATQFPHADVVGIDLVPPALLSVDDIPPNCRFEVDDANLSMSHYANCFNVVHARSADAGINDFNGFLYEVAQTIRPGGILILASGLPQIYDENLTPFPVTEPGEEGFSWLQKTLYYTYVIFHSRGNYAVDVCLHWVKWLKANPNFESVKSANEFIPLGPWKKNLDETANWVAECHRIDTMHLLHSFKPLLLLGGHSQEYVDYMVDMAHRELRELNLKGHARWQYTTAVRTQGPWQERLEMPVPLEQAKELLIVGPSPPGTKSSTASCAPVYQKMDPNLPMLRRRPVPSTLGDTESSSDRAARYGVNAVIA